MNKRLLFFSLALALFLSALPLPWLMAVPALRGQVFTWLGTRLSGTISADSCSFGWFSGLHCKGFSYHSNDQPFQLKAPELRSSKGLALLLLAPRYLGDIRIKEPVVSLNLSPAAPAGPKQLGVSSGLVFLWNNSSFQVQAQRGQVLLQHGETSSPLLTDAGLSAALENGSLGYTLEARAGTSAEANLRAEGLVNAPPESNSPARLLSTSTIVLEPSRIADLPPLPWAPWLFPAMDGSASGTCRLLRNVDGSVQAQGALSLHEALLPPFTAEDTRLKLEKASLLFDVSRLTKGRWRLEQAQFDSDLASFDLRGVFQAEKSDLNASASLSLPLLSEGLRQRLALYPDARLESGQVQCSVQAAGPASRLPLQLHCSVSDIAAQKADTPIAWKKPLTLSAKGLWQNHSLSLQEVQGRGALLSFEAGPSDGGATTFLNAGSDLGALNGELGKIMHLPLQAEGKLTLAASRQREGTASWRDELNFRIKDFTLRTDTAELLPAHEFSLKGMLAKADSGVLSGKAQGSWWPGSFDIVLDDVSGHGDQSRGRYSINGSMLLARVQPLVQNFMPALASLKMAGSLQLDLSAQLQGSRHQLNSVQAQLNRPVIRASAKDSVYTFQASRSVLAAGKAAEKLPAPRSSGFAPLQMAGNADTLPSQQSELSFIDLDKQTVSLQPIVFHSDGVQLRGGISFAQWRQGQPQYSVHAHGAMDGAMLDTLLRAFSRMPAGIKLQGPVQLAFRSAYPGKPLPEAELAAQLDWVGFMRDERPLFHQQKLNLYARFEAAESSSLSSWDIPEFSLHSPDFWASGKGFLWDEGRGSGMLALQGQYRKTGAQETEQEQAAETNPFQVSVPFH